MSNLIVKTEPAPPLVYRAVRVFGGAARPAVQEIAVQLRFVQRARLFGLELIEPEHEFKWNLMMKGPKHSPYRGGLFSLSIDFPGDYPYSPPVIKFNTPIFHPNVFADGSLCWHDDDTTGSRYFADVLIGAVNTLLEEPNPASPANGEAATLFNNNRAEYNRRAKQFTAEHAYAG